MDFSIGVRGKVFRVEDWYGNTIQYYYGDGHSITLVSNNEIIDRLDFRYIEIDGVYNIGTYVVKRVA